MKKGYVMLMDLIFALLIIIVGYMVIASRSHQITQSPSLESVVANQRDVWSSITVDQLCPINCACSNETLSQLCEQGIFVNNKSNLIDTIGLWYFLNTSTGSYDSYPRTLISMITNNTLRRDLYGVRVSVNNTVLFESAPKKQTTELLSTQHIIMGSTVNASNGEMMYWGPYLARIEVYRT